MPSGDKVLRVREIEAQKKQNELLDELVDAVDALTERIEALEKLVKEKQK